MTEDSGVSRAVEILDALEETRAYLAHAQQVVREHRDNTRRANA